MPEELVEALWVGSHPAELPDRRVLVPGKDTCLIGRTEAETSENWQIIAAADAGTARELVDHLATATGEDAQATLDREQATSSPRKTVVEAAERRLRALQTAADTEADDQAAEAAADAPADDA